MRDIRFRAWDKENKLMIKNVGFQYGDTGLTVLLEQVMIPPDGSDFEYHHGIRGSRCELMQYTGLKDKNGKEIYEGDIVETEYLKQKQVRVVEWGEVSDSEYDCDIAYGFVFGFGDHQVIGNIYENPDLLKP